MRVLYPTELSTVQPYVCWWSPSPGLTLSCGRLKDCCFIQNRPLAIRAAYSHVPILDVILGFKIVYKHAQKRVDTQIYAHIGCAFFIVYETNSSPLHNAKRYRYTEVMLMFLRTVRTVNCPMICLSFESVTSYAMGLYFTRKNSQPVDMTLLVTDQLL